VLQTTTKIPRVYNCEELLKDVIPLTWPHQLVLQSDATIWRYSLKLHSKATLQSYTPKLQSKASLKLQSKASLKLQSED